jgi:23S rRNA pseudouridine1911/1915/1917 synthase
MRRRITLHQTVPYDASGQRFDQVTAQLFPQFSRARLQTWIKNGEITINGQAFKGNGKIVGGETINLDVEVQDEGQWEAQAIALDVVFEDEAILVVNKPAGMVVHPAAGNPEGTLLNALLHYCPQLAGIPRAGIVHRLDKDTTGLMVVAKTLEAQNHLVNQLQNRTVSRQYQALVVGRVIAGGTVNLPIGRDSKHRKKMAVSKTGEGKEAITHYEVAERFSYFTRLNVKLETGRTHQIRVHMSHIRFPLVGDPAYGGGGKGLRSSVINEEVLEAVKAFPRQALHAQSLALIHPVTQQPCQWQAPIPADMLELLELMRCYD